jgi:uncharacterized protein YjiS (DUF1127 family)
MNQVYIELSSAAEGREPRGHHGLREATVRIWRATLEFSRLAAHQIRVWRERMQQRRELMYLGDEGLKDIGVGPSEAFREYSKPFWRE